MDLSLLIINIFEVSSSINIGYLYTLVPILGDHIRLKKLNCFRYRSDPMSACSLYLNDTIEATHHLQLID